MAENQTASEDSGQQQQQQQQQEQQQNNNQQLQQDSSPDQESSSDSITPNPKSKTLHLKYPSASSTKVARSASGSSEETTRQSPGSGKHHHHNHHHHHLHNNTGSGNHAHHVIHRTTSESLRLASSDHPAGSSGNMTNSTSKSSSIRGGGSSTLASTTTTNNSNSTTSNHSHSMSSSSSHSHSSHPHPHSHSHSHQHPSNSSGGPPQRKQKTSSFQITSVTVGNKLSSDNGDDSADDLDESHTDDNSRITDLENETPSVSEDTFSKEDVFFANNALSTTAPVIPTSAQYGLVVVDPIGPSVGQTIQNVQVNVADNIINVVSAVGNKKKPEVKETQHRSERFKVVKIESTEPFRRGRWMCMDYLDHSGNQALNKDINPEKNKSGSGSTAVASSVSGTTGDETSRGTTQTAIILTNDTNAINAGVVENHIDAAAKLTADGNLNIYRSESQTSAGTGQNTNQTIIHAQTMAGPMNMQQQQQQHQSQLPNQFQGQQFETGHGQTMPNTDFHQQEQQQVNGNEHTNAGQSLSATVFGNILNSAEGGNNSSTSTFQQQSQQQQQSTPAHGVTLPANIHLQKAATNFQPIAFASQPTTAQSGAEATVPPGTSTQQQPANQQQQQLSSQTYASQSNTNPPPQSFSNGANNVGGAAYPPTNPVVSDSMQGTQQSDSNAATPSGGGQSQSQSQQQQQQQPTQQQFQQQSLHSNPVAGQTMPNLNQMTYDPQSQQQQQQSSQTATNTPVTISDPTAITATIQQQHQVDTNNFTTTNNNNSNNNNTATSSNSTAAESSNNNVSGGTGGGGGGGSSGGGSGSGSGSGSGPTTANNISQQQTQQNPQQSSSGGSVQGSTSGGGVAATSTTGSAEDHQLHHNPETETESYASSLAFALAKRGKRDSSNPQLPILAPIFNFNESIDPLNANNEDITETQNIFTSLALGDDTYKLLNNSDETIDNLGSNENEAAAKRSLPIPITGRQMSYESMAHSASPTTSAHPYSPFYYGSPSSAADTAGQAFSISYEPRYVCSSNRLYVPTSIFQGHHNDRLVGVIDGMDAKAKTSSATAIFTGGGAASVLNSASGTSAVAIDNKIEQAMDLVKSHLMIAVREEVEVLKEKISELMDKINQLEVENTILKANMSQETLHQLQLQTQLQIAGSGTGNMIAQQPQQQSQPQPQQQQQQQPQQQQQQAQQQPAAQQSQQPSQQQQQPQQPPQQQQAPQANTANATNGPIS